MSRFRLYPTREQEQRLTLYCAHARYVWNLALEQMNYGVPGRWMPNYAAQSRQLTEARREHEWLRDVPTIVGDQALRDFRQACANWWGRTHRRPTWRRRGRHEGFRVKRSVGPIRTQRLNRRWSNVYVPSLGWVKFRRTRAVPVAKSYRITQDPAGRWHIAFAVKPEPVCPPGNREVIGVDRGVAVSLAYSDGTLLCAPRPAAVKHAAQAVARCKPGSRRRKRSSARLARAYAHNANRRRDFIEKATTDLARRADLIRVEDLRIGNMTRSARGTIAQPGRNVRAKAGLNRAILASGWGMFVRRLQDKAPGRVEKINPAFTSLTCSRCRTVDREARESQAVFRCRSCGHTANADVNAACNIAAGRAARGAEQLAASKRRPQTTTSVAELKPWPDGQGDVKETSRVASVP